MTQWFVVKVDIFPHGSRKVQGLEVCGPFNSNREAREWAEDQFEPETDYTITVNRDPKEY